MVLPLSGCSKEPTDVTLTVWAPAEDQDETAGNWLKTMCDKFNEAHPEWNITFQYGTCSEGDIGKTIPADPKNSADVYLFANDQIGALKEANAIAKLGGKAAEEVKANNPQLLVDSVTVDGDIYGIPFTSNTWFMYYDKSVFTEEDVKSLDTMVAKAKISFPMTTAWYNGSFFLANGGTMFGDGTDGSAGIQFGGDNGLAVVNYLVDLVNNPNFVNDADQKGMAGLRDGSIGAIFSGAWDYSNVKEALGDNFGAAQLPTITINGEEKQLLSFAGSKAIGVNPNCENPEVAVALAAYLGGEEAQKAHFEMRKGSVIPCNTKLAEDESVKNDPAYIAQNATFNSTSIVQPNVPEMGPYWSAAETFGKAVVAGDITKANAEAKLTDYMNQLNAK
jgi:arabinogalactan oligomer/maltooligosaccharide transport system substrate-binding protein